MSVVVRCCRQVSKTRYKCLNTKRGESNQWFIKNEKSVSLLSLHIKVLKCQIHRLV